MNIIPNLIFFLTNSTSCICFSCSSFFLFSNIILSGIGVPHFVQNNASSSISLPQFLQNSYNRKIPLTNIRT